MDLQMLMRETHAPVGGVGGRRAGPHRQVVEQVVLPVSSLHCGIAAEAFVIS
jgi:hypothetical protein